MIESMYILFIILDFFMYSFDSSIKRVGFACKFSEINKKGMVASVPELNTGSTTLAWAKRNKRNLVEQKLIDIAKCNIVATHNLVKKIASLEPARRMVRITSDMFSLYTHAEYKDFWNSSDIQDNLTRWMAPIGETARQHDVRLSFHPGQFCVLASADENIVKNSIDELEYHVDMARFMGYGKQFQDMKINLHISGRKGPQGIRDVYGRLSPEARNTLTLENEEYTYGLSDCLSLSDLVPTVLDIHHHSIREGEYIQSDDPRIQQVIASWRGTRPTIHYSLSREDVLINHRIDQLPDMKALIASGISKQKLRAHSEYMWNDAANDWAKTHWSWADTMIECKAKNLASEKLLNYWKNT